MQRLMSKAFILPVKCVSHKFIFKLATIKQRLTDGSSFVSGTKALRCYVSGRWNVCQKGCTSILWNVFFILLASK